MTVIELQSDPALSARALRWRALERERVTLVAKVAFTFARGEVALAPQVPIEEEDLAPYLGRAEVLFRGRSFARVGGRARLSVLRGVEMLLDKSLVANRHDATGIPIVFERAYGGPGFAANPLGSGVAPGSAAPDFSHASDPRLPATFLPIPMAWRARASTLSDAHRAGLAASPIFIGEGFPWSALQSAPTDQQLASLECGDDVLLENLIEGVPSARLRIPAFQIRFEPWAGLSAPAARIDTLRIDGERRSGVIVVRAVLPLTQPAARLSIQVGFATPRPSASASAPSPPAPPPAAAGQGRREETADVEGDPSLRAVAPFPLGAPKEAPVDSIAAARALWRQSTVAPATAQTRQPKTTTLNAAPAPTAAPPPPAMVASEATPPPSAPAPAAPIPAPARAPRPAKARGPSLGQQFLERSRKK